MPTPPLRQVAAAEPPAAESWRERIARRWGRPLLEQLFSSRRAVVSGLRAIPDRMQRVTNQARLVMELAEDFRNGRYRDISWVSIAVAAGALVYVVSPGDVVPDALPILGTLDDMVVLTLTMRFLEKDLRAYCRFRGYAETDYF
jgi:uncharacterized membrane protein YkvA (DUF1232 family)